MEVIPWAATVEVIPWAATVEVIPWVAVVEVIPWAATVEGIPWAATLNSVNMASAVVTALNLPTTAVAADSAVNIVNFVTKNIILINRRTYCIIQGLYHFYIDKNISCFAVFIVDWYPDLLIYKRSQLQLCLAYQWMPLLISVLHNKFNFFLVVHIIKLKYDRLLVRE